MWLDITIFRALLQKYRYILILQQAVVPSSMLNKILSL